MRHKYTLRLILLNIVIVTANGLTYFGLSLNSPNLPGNAYLNIFYSALVELLGYLTIMTFAAKFSRRSCMIISQAIAGFSCLISILLIEIGEANDDSFILSAGRYISFGGKLAISASFGLWYLIIAEVFAVEVSMKLLGLVQLMGRFGIMLAPFILQLSSILSWLPLVIFGLVSLVASYSSLIILTPFGALYVYI